MQIPHFEGRTLIGSPWVHMATGAFLPAVGASFLCPWNVGFHPTEDVELWRPRDRLSSGPPGAGWKLALGIMQGTLGTWLSPELPAHQHCKCLLLKWADLILAWEHCLATASWCVPSCVHKQPDNVHGDLSQHGDPAGGYFRVSLPLLRSTLGNDLAADSSLNHSIRNKTYRRLSPG